jgi:predicted nucleic acid-binding protein
MSLKSSAPDSVVDANVFIAICAKEAKTYSVALAEMGLRVQAGCAIYAPGVLIVETLYILCRKLENGVMGPAQHRRAIQRLRHGVRGILPPPQGDASLAIRAEEIRSGYGCSRSADGLYIALAEQLAQTGPAELVTFDAGMATQAAAVAPSVVVRLLVIP